MKERVEIERIPYKHCGYIPKLLGCRRCSNNTCRNIHLELLKERVGVTAISHINHGHEFGLLDTILVHKERKWYWRDWSCVVRCCVIGYCAAVAIVTQCAQQRKERSEVRAFA